VFDILLKSFRKYEELAEKGNQVKQMTGCRSETSKTRRTGKTKNLWCVIYDLWTVKC